MLKHLASALCALALVVPAVAAAQAYPSRPVKIVIPFAAGGTADPLARLLADSIERRTGAKFVIEARPGAGGNVGNQAVAAAEKDGYTLLLGANNNFVVNQYLLAGSVDVMNAFALVSILVDQPQVVYVRADAAPKTFKELIEYVKARPGQINYASPGTGSAPHLSGEILSDLYGLQMAHVPYKGGAPAITAMLAGEVQLYLASLSVGKSHVVSGKLRALATTSPTRLSALPEVPTTRETGHTDYQMINWWGLAAPSGSPPAALQWVQREMAQSMREPEIARRLDDLGFVVFGSTPEQFEERVRRESQMYEKLIRTRQIKAQ